MQLQRRIVLRVLPFIAVLVGLVLMVMLAPYFLLPRKTSTNNNRWVRANDSDTAIVFVHGIFSDSNGCWTKKDAKHGDHFFPKMVKDDADFGEPSIFVAGYATTVKAGKYGVASSAADVWKALATSEDGFEPAIRKRNIIFVCHSTGGIVVRYLLLDKQQEFRDKNVGLVLIASPSAGSEFATLLTPLAAVYDAQLASELRDKNNALLEDLDDRFRELVYHRQLHIAGVEAFEQNGLIGRLIGKAVPKESASRYFGRPEQLAGQDHITSVKPADQHHPAYSLLLHFYTQDFRQMVEAAAHTTPPFETADRRWQTDTSDVSRATISPDGHDIAYVRLKRGQPYLMLTSTDHTDSASVVLPPSSDRDYRPYWGITFDPEADWIYYVRSRENAKVSDLWRVRRNGTHNEEVLSDVDSGITFNPRLPRQFAYFHGNPGAGESDIVVATMDGKAPRATREPKARAVRRLPQYFVNASWSPSATALLLISGEMRWEEMTLSILSAEGNERRIASDQRWRSIDSAVWLPSGEILFTATASSGGPQRIWLTRPSGGKTISITRDLGNYRSLAVTADGKHLAAIQDITQSRIYFGYTGKSSYELSTNGSRLDGFDGIAAAPNSAVIFTRRSGPSQDLIYYDPARAETRELVAGEGINELPAICSDAGFAVFARTQNGTKNIWKVTLDAAPRATRLTTGEWDGYPSCSPDGKRIVYSAIDPSTSQRGLWMIEGDSRRLLTAVDARNSAFSPDGTRIATIYADEKKDYAWRVGILDPQSGRITPYDGVRIAVAEAPRLRWLSNEEITVVTQHPSPLLRSRHITTGVVRAPVLLPDAKRVFDFDWIEPGGTFAYAGGSIESDIVTLSENP